MFTSTQLRRATTNFSRLGLIAIIALLSSVGQVFATENHLTKSETSLEFLDSGFSLDLSDLQQIPTITFVDKNLNIVAEFYGDFSMIKMRFPESFQEASLLNEFHNHKIFLVKSNIKK